VGAHSHKPRPQTTLSIYTASQAHSSKNYIVLYVIRTTKRDHNTGRFSPPAPNSDTSHPAITAHTTAHPYIHTHHGVSRHTRLSIWNITGHSQTIHQARVLADTSGPFQPAQQQSTHHPHITSHDCVSTTKEYPTASR
jgi:hypothetical protein